MSQFVCFLCVILWLLDYSLSISCGVSHVWEIYMCSVYQFYIIPRYLGKSSSITIIEVCTKYTLYQYSLVRVVIYMSSMYQVQIIPYALVVLCNVYQVCIIPIYLGKSSSIAIYMCSVYQLYIIPIYLGKSNSITIYMCSVDHVCTIPIYLHNVV